MTIKELKFLKKFNLLLSCPYQLEKMRDIFFNGFDETKINKFIKNIIKGNKMIKEFEWGGFKVWILFKKERLELRVIKALQIIKGQDDLL